jgi:hypothetical protein
LTFALIYVLVLFMSAPPTMMDRHRLLLGELADMSMALARRFHDAALEAPVEEAQGLVLGFQRASRNLRQTLALEARLEREARRAVVEIAAERQARRETRRLQVKSTLSNLIWTERESLDLGRLLLELDGRIDMASLGEAFLDDPVETVIARLRHDLGLPANDAGLEGGGSDPSPPSDPSPLQDPSCAAAQPLGPSPLAGEGGLAEQGRMRGLSELSDQFRIRSG